MKITDLPASVRAQLQSERHTILTVRLPYPPSLNTYYRHVGAKVLISAKGREYRQQVQALALGRGHVEGRLNVYLVLFPPDKKRRDVDNTAKGLLDALTHAGIYGDDSQIDMLTIARREVVDGGAVQVIIMEMT